MATMRAGRMNRFVTLWRSPTATDDADGFFEALSPSTAWCAIQPAGVSIGDQTRIMSSTVTMRFHPQVTIDTKLVYTDQTLGRDRELFVKSVQNIDDAGSVLVLSCDEVWP